jgi:glutathione S-transferase
MRTVNDCQVLRQFTAIHLKEVYMQPTIQIIGVQFSSFTRSVQLCAEEIGLSYNLGVSLAGKEYGFRSSELSSINPFGKVPVLIQGDRVLYETQSICRYLDASFNQSRLQLQDPWLRAQVDQWCAAISVYIDRNIVRNYLLEYLFPQGDNGSVRMDKVEAALPDIANTLAILTQQLGANNFLVGNQFSLADILLIPSLHYLTEAPHGAQLIAADSSLRDYVQRIVGRPAGVSVFI